MNDSYIPGMCNIGPAERRARRNLGIASLIATIILLAVFVLFDVTSIWRIIIFIPATSAATGFLQARLHFCVRFGMSGLFNFGNDLSKHESVEKAEFRRKDQRKALIIISGSAVIGAVVTIISLLL